MTSTLTNHQRLALETALAHDGAAVAPAGMGKGAAMKVGASLIGRKLMREARSKPGMPVWRRDDCGRDMSLILTAAGRRAIEARAPAGAGEIETADRASPETESSKTMRSAAAAAKASVAEAGGDRVKADASPKTAGPKDRPKARSAAADASPRAATPEQGTGGAPRAGSKQALVVGMLSKEPGATIDDLVAATGWLPHTTRAALTALRKRGFRIERTRGEKQGSRYRIANPLAA